MHAANNEYCSLHPFLDSDDDVNVMHTYMQCESIMHALEARHRCDPLDFSA